MQFTTTFLFSTALSCSKSISPVGSDVVVWDLSTGSIKHRLAGISTAHSVIVLISVLVSGVGGNVQPRGLLSHDGSFAAIGDTLPVTVVIVI